MTELLRRELNRSRGIVGAERKVANKKYIANQVVGALTTGAIQFVDGSAITLQPRDWTDLTKWLFARIDGAIPKPVELTPTEPLKIVVEYVHESLQDES